MFTTIHICPQRLSDGSMVFNVEVEHDGKFLKFHAYSEADARTFARDFCDLIDLRTVDSARVKEWREVA